MTLTIYGKDEFEQRSPQWYAARAGLVTASAVGKLITPTLRVADNDTSRGLITTLAAERITGHVEETPFTRDMERGVISEDFARDAYEAHTGVTVEQVGFIVREEPMPWNPNDLAHPVDAVVPTWRLGYSPDGLVGDDGLIEIKAPRAKGHIVTVLNGKPPAYYMAQLQTGLLVTGRKWIDYVSFYGGMHLYTIRVHPDERWFSAITEAAQAAEDAITDITTRYAQATADLPLTDPIVDLVDTITF